MISQLLLAAHPIWAAAAPLAAPLPTEVSTAESAAAESPKHGSPAAGPFTAGDPAPEDPATEDPATEDPATGDEVKRATAWPEFAKKAELKKSISQVRKARTEEMAIKGAQRLEEIGPAAAPLLLKSLKSEKDAEARARLEAALDSVTGPKHTRLLAEILDESARPPRRYAARRIAELGDPGLRERSEAHLAALTAEAANKRARQPVEAVDLDLAAVLCLSAGSPKGLERVISLAAPEPWKSWSPAIEQASAHARSAGPEIGAELSQRLSRSTTPGDRVVLLRLITYAASEDQIAPVVLLLDAEQNHVKVASINALRMIVDGEPPLKRMSSFDAIEHAKRWKARL